MSAAAALAALLLCAAVFTWWWSRQAPPGGGSVFRTGGAAGAVSGPELRRFTREFAGLMHEGRSLDVCLTSLAERQTNPAFRRSLADVHATVMSGYPLSRAMARHPEVFGPSYVAAVRRGEVDGNLDVVLARVE